MVAFDDDDASVDHEVIECGAQRREVALEACLVTLASIRPVEREVRREVGVDLGLVFARQLHVPGRTERPEALNRCNGLVWDRRALRAHIVNAEPELRGRARAGYHEFGRAVADATGKDLGQPGTALVPQLAALTAVTGLRELYETDEARALPSPPTAAGLLALVGRVVALTRAGIDGSPDTSTSRRKPHASTTGRASGKHR